MHTRRVAGGSLAEREGTGAVQAGDARSFWLKVLRRGSAQEPRPNPLPSAMARYAADDAELDALIAAEDEGRFNEEDSSPWRGLPAEVMEPLRGTAAAPAFQVRLPSSPEPSSGSSLWSSGARGAAESIAGSPWSSSLGSSPQAAAEEGGARGAGAPPERTPRPAREEGAAGSGAARQAAEASAGEAPQRRRLRRKTAPPPGYGAGGESTEATSDANMPAAPGPEVAPARLSALPNYYGVVELLRKTFAAHEERKRGEGGPDETRRSLRARARQSYAVLPLAQRIELCEEVLAEAAVSRNLLHSVRLYQKNLFAREKAARKDEKKKQEKDYIIRGVAVLLTYFGGRHLDVASALEADPSVDDVSEVARHVQKQDACKAVVKSCTEFVQTLAKGLDVPRFAWALETCPRTWAADRKVKLHLHVALVRNHKPFHHYISHMKWENLTPNCSKQTCVCRDKQSAGPAMLFYCQIAKVGHVANGGSHEPFHDYHVNPEWITNLVQAGKVTAEVARDLYVRGAKNVVHHLQNLDRLVAEKRSAALSARVALVQATCAAQISKFKTLPVVTEQWLPHFQHVKARYPFLVLEGPSGTGKTSYAKHITGNPDEVLEVNCAACPEPDLRELDPEIHKGILFDEASATMVLAQRRLFQAPPCWVDLGCSTTNCHKYQVFLSGMMLMVASNTWTQQVAQLEHAGDRQWLGANSYVVHVREPLWEQR